MMLAETDEETAPQSRSRMARNSPLKENPCERIARFVLYLWVVSMSFPNCDQNTDSHRGCHARGTMESPGRA